MREKFNSLAVFFIELLRFGIGKDKIQLNTINRMRLAEIC